MSRLRKKIIWEFDMLIYRLFYWRWNRRLIEDDKLRRLFVMFINSWEYETDTDRGGDIPMTPHPGTVIDFIEKK